MFTYSHLNSARRIGRASWLLPAVTAGNGVSAFQSAPLYTGGNSAHLVGIVPGLNETAMSAWTWLPGKWSPLLSDELCARV